MAKEGNFQRGEVVPRTGTYKCIFCGPDGVCALVLKEAMKTIGVPYDPPALATAKPPYRFFHEGDTFPSCPNCEHGPGDHDGTGWSFVSEKEIKGKGKCFIATACCGSSECGEVLALRRFRDDVLRGRRWGRLFVSLYERCSPPLAAWIQCRPGCRDAVRRTVVGPAARIAAGWTRRETKRA